MNRFFKLAAATICFIAIFKLIVPLPHENNVLVKEFWSKKTHAPNDFDYIACGDSRIYRGISSDVLNGSDTVLKFFNLGYSSAGLNDEYLNFVTSKFNPTSANKVLIIGITPFSLTKKAMKNEALHKYLKLGTFDLFKQKFFTPLVKHFPIYSPKQIVYPRKLNYLQEQTEEGWIASDKILPDSTLALKNYSTTFIGNAVSRKSMANLIIKLREISAKNITVLAFRPPTTLAMKRLEDSLSGFDETYIKNELTKNSIYWLELDFSQFESYDGSHLNKKSAILLSKSIGKKINSPANN